jgi:hypothetical protein
MNKNFDLNQFEKIEDIVFIDEPILTHLKLNDLNYFLYLVDTTDSSDIFLLFEVENSNIYKYITGKISLERIISENKKIIIVLEQSFEGEFLNSYFINVSQIDPNYLPSEDSFLIINPAPSSYYYDFIREYERHYYLETLRENAFYIKFSTNNKKFGETLGLKELADNFLQKIIKSFTNYMKIDFKKQFSDHFNDTRKITTTINQLIPDLDYRMVDLKFGSFEIGLAVDEIMKNTIEDVKIKEWAKKVAFDYKDIVLDQSITEEETNHIIENFTDDERIKIFKPIIEIAEDSNFDFKIKDSYDDTYRNIGLKNKKVAREIISNISEKIISEPKQEYELVQITAIVDKNDKKRSIKFENTLFNRVDELYTTLKFEDFQKYNFLDVPNDIELKVKLQQVGDEILLSADFSNTNITVQIFDQKIEDGVKRIIEKIYEYFINTDHP